MRIYQGILLVTGLSVGMIAAGVAWERLYISPLVEQSQPKPDPPESVADDLPAGCLEELAVMERQSPAAAKTGSAEPLPTVGDIAVRLGGSSNQVATHIQVTDSAPALAPTDHLSTAHRIQQAQSAVWT